MPRPDLRAEQLYVLEYLAKRGFPHAPSVLRTRSGGRVAHGEQGMICVLELVPHALVQEGESRTRAWGRLGHTAAALNLNAHDRYPLPFAIPIHSTLHDLALRASGRSFERPFLHLLTRAALVEESKANALVHGEVNEANARRRADGTVVLVDWDQAGFGPAVLEYGYPLIHVFLSEDLTFDTGTATAFYQAYLDAGGAIDRRQVFNVALFHALRYMWWGNTHLRWERTVYAVAHEDEICSAIP